MRKNRRFFRQKGFYNEISIRNVNFQCNFRENGLFSEILIEKVKFLCEYDRILIEKEN